MTLRVRVPMVGYVRAPWSTYYGCLRVGAVAVWVCECTRYRTTHAAVSCAARLRPTVLAWLGIREDDYPYDGYRIAVRERKRWREENP